MYRVPSRLEASANVHLAAASLVAAVMSIVGSVMPHQPRRDGISRIVREEVEVQAYPSRCREGVTHAGIAGTRRHAGERRPPRPRVELDGRGDRPEVLEALVARIRAQRSNRRGRRGQRKAPGDALSGRRRLYGVRPSPQYPLQPRCGRPRFRAIDVGCGARSEGGRSDHQIQLRVPGGGGYREIHKRGRGQREPVMLGVC